MKSYYLTLDLKDDPELIRQYEDYHEKVWPEIISSIKNSGVENMIIYRYKTRLFMIMEVSDDFSFQKKNEADNNNPKVQEWEQLMSKFHQPTGGNKAEKWKLMSKIFELKNYR